MCLKIAQNDAFCFSSRLRFISLHPIPWKFRLTDNFVFLSIRWFYFLVVFSFSLVETLKWFAKQISKPTTKTNWTKIHSSTSHSTTTKICSFCIEIFIVDIRNGRTANKEKKTNQINMVGKRDPLLFCVFLLVVIRWHWHREDDNIGTEQKEKMYSFSSK